MNKYMRPLFSLGNFPDSLCHWNISETPGTRRGMSPLFKSHLSFRSHFLIHRSATIYFRDVVTTTDPTMSRKIYYSFFPLPSLPFSFLSSPSFTLLSQFSFFSFFFPSILFIFLSPFLSLSSFSSKFLHILQGSIKCSLFSKLSLVLILIQEGSIIT